MWRNLGEGTVARSPLQSSASESQGEVVQKTAYVGPAFKGRYEFNR